MGAGILIVAASLTWLACDFAAAQARHIAPTRRALPCDDRQHWFSAVIPLPPSRAYPGVSRRVWPAASFIRHCSFTESGGGSR